MAELSANTRADVSTLRERWRVSALRTPMPAVWPSATADEPWFAAAARTLLYPVTAVSLLAVFVVANHAALRPYGVAAVLLFTATRDFLGHAVIRAGLRRSFVDITLRWFLALGFVCGLMYVVGWLDRAPLLLGLYSFVTPLALHAVQFAARPAVARLSVRTARPRNAVIIGATELGIELAARLHADPALAIRLLGYFDERAVERLPCLAASGQRVLGRLSDVQEFVRRNEVALVYIMLPMSPQARILGLLADLRDCTASVYFVPNLSPFGVIQHRVDAIHDIPVVAICESPFIGVRGAIKRLMDLSLSAIALLLFSPLMGLISVGVRLSSPGPVIFIQRRYGLDGKEIRVRKFRTLTVTEDGERTYRQVIGEDSRVTRFGAFLRRTSLDELPQLFNVLVGSMSLVGPRPHAIAVNEQYRRLIPGYMVRHKVRPGITGWAQVNGCRGGDNLDGMTRRVQYDLEYLRNWSLRLDIVILWKTLRLVLSDRNAC